MSKVDTIKKILSWSVLLIFIIGVQILWGWGEILRPWQQMNWLTILLAVTLMVLTYQLRTWRLYSFFYTHLQGHWFLALRLILLNNFFNMLLPMRSGEVSFPLLMKRYFNIEYSQSIPALLWFRLLDLHTILSIGLLPFLLEKTSIIFAIFSFGVWMMIPLFIYILRHYLKNRILQKEGWRNAVHKLLDGLPQNVSTFLKSWALTIVNWVVKLAIFVWVLDQFVQVDLLHEISAVIAGELSSVLPFHAPGGVGTYEAGIAAVLSTVVSVDQAMQSAINVHLFVLGASSVGAIIAWLIPNNQDNR